MPDMTIPLAGETVILLPERVLYWPRAGTLFVADLHWGYVESHRAQCV